MLLCSLGPVTRQQWDATEQGEGERERERDEKTKLQSQLDDKFHSSLSGDKTKEQRERE